MGVNIGWPERLLRLAAGTLILGLYGALTGPGRYITLVALAFRHGTRRILPLRAALGGRAP